jgi:hypothetical protein
MNMKKWEKSPEDLVERFDRIVPTDPAVERRKMFGYPCAFVNGHMFTGLFGSQMFVRLPEGERKALVDKRGVKPLEPIPGRPMKEYVVVPPDILAGEVALRRLVVKSLAYAKDLPPKEKKPAKKAKS